MTFEWPLAFLVLLAVPLVLLVAWWSRRRRRRAAVRVTSAALVRAALPGRTAWRRRLPAALLVAGLAVLAVGAARPQAVVAVSKSSTTILLALDVSGSMCSTDVAPNRLEVAQKAAADFIRAQPGGARIGLVVFAAVAGLVVPPTDDTGKLLDALKHLTTARGTAIGQAILTSVDAIAEVDPSVAPTGSNVQADAGAPYAPEVVVVLTDGANTQGVDPSDAATVAAERKVRVYTIGFGTTTPAPMVCSADQTDGEWDGGWGGPGPGGGGGFGGGSGRGNPLVIDEPALQGVADTTGGRYYRAESAGELESVLAKLPRTITMTHKHTDLANWFAGAGALLAVVAIALSLWWNRVRPLNAA